MLFVYILFKLVKILDFDGLVFKCYFFMLNRPLNVVDHVLNDMYDENCMKLMSYVWIMYELLLDDIKYEKSMFNIAHLTSLMI